MPEKCKGSKLKVAIYRCSRCFETVEIFSDEKKASCTHCGATILITTANKCMEWCALAGSCMAKTVKKQAKRSRKKT